MFIYKGPKMKLGSVCRADRAQSNGPILLIDSENHNAELATLSQILEESQLQTNVFKTSSSNLCFELGMQHDPNTATVETHTVSLSCSLSLSLSLSRAHLESSSVAALATREANRAGALRRRRQVQRRSAGRACFLLRTQRHKRSASQTNSTIASICVRGSQRNNTR